jgi:hypothetical protein
MPTITLQDLENAAADAAHIASIATSPSLSATDRLGTSKMTLAGAINAISGITVRGAWVTSTAYATKDVFSNSGTWYVCLVAHTSGSFGTDLAAGKFVVYQGVTSADLSASGGSALVGFLQAGTGAVARTAQAKARDWISVKDFGALGNGSNDDTAEIQLAIDYAATLGGGTVFFPAGSYKISSALAVTSKAIQLIGASMYSTSILKTGADCSSVVFSDAASDVCAVEQLRFAPFGGVTQTSGFVINFSISGALGTRISRVLMEDIYSAIGCDLAPLSVNDVIVSDCELLRCVKYGLYMKGALNWMVENCIVSMTNGAANTFALVLDGNAEGCFFKNSYFLGGEHVFRSTGNNKENRFTNVAFDGGSVSTSCVYDSASKRNHFLGCWASTQATGGRGIVIDSTSVVGFRWTDGEIVGIAQHGIEVSAAGDFHIIGGRICNWGIAAAGTYSGITVAANAATRFSIKDVVFAQDADLSGNSWNGININTGTYAHYDVTGNFGIGLTGALIADTGTCSTARVMDNAGFNPKGASAVTVTASPMTYTAGHSPETLYIKGGTVSSVAQGGQTLYTATDKSVHLGPNEAVVITYSSAPTISVQKH